MSGDKSYLQYDVFIKSLVGILLLGGVAVDTNQSVPSSTDALLPVIAAQSGPPRNAGSITPVILLQMLQANAAELNATGLAGVEKPPSLSAGFSR